jgi:hypothetical protein
MLMTFLQKNILFPLFKNADPSGPTRGTDNKKKEETEEEVEEEAAGKVESRGLMWSKKWKTKVRRKKNEEVKNKRKQRK